MFYFERFSLLRTSATTDPPSQFSILEFKNQMIFLSRYLVFSRSAAGQELCYHGASRWETAHSRRLRNNKHALVSQFHSAVDGVLFPSGSKPRRACSDTTGMFFWERTLLIFLYNPTIFLLFAGGFVALSLPWEWAQPISLCATCTFL